MAAIAELADSLRQVIVTIDRQRAGLAAIHAILLPAGATLRIFIGDADAEPTYWRTYSGTGGAVRS